MQNVVKWPNILLKSCSVHTARFVKYVWPFYNIMHERVNNVCKIKHSWKIVNAHALIVKTIP